MELSQRKMESALARSNPSRPMLVGVSSAHRPSGSESAGEAAGGPGADNVSGIRLGPDTVVRIVGFCSRQNPFIVTS